MRRVRQNQDVSDDDDDVEHPYGQTHPQLMIKDLLTDMYKWERRLAELEYKKKMQGGHLEDRDYMEHTQIHTHLDKVTDYLKEQFIPVLEKWIKGHKDPQAWADRMLGLGEWSVPGYDEEEMWDRLKENKFIWGIGGTRGGQDLKPCLLKRLFSKSEYYLDEFRESNNPFRDRIDDSMKPSERVKKLTDMIDQVQWSNAVRASGFTEEQIIDRNETENDRSKKFEAIPKEETLAGMINRKKNYAEFIESINPYKDADAEEIVQMLQDDYGDLMDALNWDYIENDINMDDVSACLAEHFREWYGGLWQSRGESKSLYQIVGDAERTVEMLKNATKLGEKIAWLDHVVNLQHYGGYFSDYLGFNKEFVDKLKGRKYIKTQDGERRQAYYDKNTDKWIVEIQGVKYKATDRWERSELTPLEGEEEKAQQLSEQEKKQLYERAKRLVPLWFKPEHKDNLEIEYMIEDDGSGIVEGYMRYPHDPNPKSFTEPRNNFYQRLGIQPPVIQAAQPEVQQQKKIRKK